MKRWILLSFSPLLTPLPTPSTSLALLFTVKFHQWQAPVRSGSEPFPGRMARNGMWSREQPRQVPTGTRGKGSPSFLTPFSCALPGKRSLGHPLCASLCCDCINIPLSAGVHAGDSRRMRLAMGGAWNPPEYVDSSRARWVEPEKWLGPWRKRSVTTHGQQPQDCDGRCPARSSQAWRAEVF